MLFDRVLFLLANAMPPVAPWDDLTEKPAPARPQINLQEGFRQWNEGQTDTTMRDGLLALVAIVAAVALIIHLVQRYRARQTPDSEARLGLELAKLVPFPFGTRVLLWWVARTTGRPFATLLISPQAYQQAVTAWADAPTFGPLRRWGRARLQRLEAILFS